MEAASSQPWEPAASRGCKTFARSTKDATSQLGQDLGAQLGLQQCSVPAVYVPFILDLRTCCPSQLFIDHLAIAARLGRRRSKCFISETVGV